MRNGSGQRSLPRVFLVNRSTGRFVSAAAVLVAVAAPLAHTETLYKYRDAAGLWVYSDRMPSAVGAGDRAAASAAMQDTGVHLQQRVDESGMFVIEAVNEFPAWVQIAFRIEATRNLDSGTPIAGNHLLPPASETGLLSLALLESGSPSEIELSFQYIFGHPGARHRPERAYRLPYTLTDAFRVSQAWPDAVSHASAANRYAVDFEMPVGTAVLAARGGVVIEAAADFIGSGLDLERDADRANFVRILHDDGTLALYGHLDWHSVRVVPGQRIERGEHLADSGNTGYSTGPHLHFVVQKNSAGEIESVPVEFDSAAGVFSPATGDFPEAR